MLSTGGELVGPEDRVGVPRSGSRSQRPASSTPLLFAVTWGDLDPDTHDAQSAGRDVSRPFVGRVPGVVGDNDAGRLVHVSCSSELSFDVVAGQVTVARSPLAQMLPGHVSAGVRADSVSDA